MTSRRITLSVLRAGRYTFLLAVASHFAACSGGASTSSTSNDPPPANHAPTIAGSPPLTITVGQAYSFTPSATDADGDALSFSISGQPAWADFDTTTGSLTGTPAVAHIGVTPAVTISVSDGPTSASLAPFDLEVTAIAVGSATVSWDIPTTNADGSPMSDLAGFEVHYGMASQTYTAVAEVKDAATGSVLIEDLEPATWYFAVKAVDNAGNRSAFSAEVSKVVQP